MQVRYRSEESDLTLPTCIRRVSVLKTVSRWRPAGNPNSSIPLRDKPQISALGDRYQGRDHVGIELRPIVAHELLDRARQGLLAGAVGAITRDRVEGIGSGD